MHLVYSFAWLIIALLFVCDMLYFTGKMRWQNANIGLSKDWQHRTFSGVVCSSPPGLVFPSKSVVL